MVQIVSFDMDGTLIESEYTDWVWHHGIPGLYAEKAGLPFEEAKDFVIREYGKVGEAGIEWYDIKYWFRLFELGMDWRSLMERYTDKIRVYPDVHPISEPLEGSVPIGSHFQRGEGIYRCRNGGHRPCRLF